MCVDDAVHSLPGQPKHPGNFCHSYQLHRIILDQPLTRDNNLYILTLDNRNAPAVWQHPGAGRDL